MRVGIVSDVHEDIEGMRQALTLLDEKGCDEIVLAFEDCEVPATSLLGAEGDGFKIAMQVSRQGPAHDGRLLPRRHGTAHRVLRGVRQDPRHLRRAHRQPPRIQWMLVDMEMSAYRVRHAVEHCAWKLDCGERVTQEAAMAKVLATEAAGRAADSAVQIHGGLGSMKGTAVERFYRDLRLTRIYEGTSEILRMLVAREMLR